MTYNLTNLSSAETIYDIFQYSNDATGGNLLGFAMIATFFILLMLMKRYDIDDIVLVDSFICTILSGFLWYINLLSFWFPLGFIAILSFSAFYSFVIKK